MIYDFYPLIAGIVGNFLAQIFKPFYKYYKTGEFDMYEAIAAGGFPSSHSSAIAAVTFSIGFKEGFDSSLFALSFSMMAIIAYDAMNVRFYAGKHIELTRQLIADIKELSHINLDDPIYFTKLKNILGHEKIEVVAGLALGIICATVFKIGLGI